MAVPVMAQGFGWGAGKQPPRGPTDPTAMQQALESGDYQAWKELVGDRPIADQITEENFAKFAEMSRLMRDGDIEGAKALREELGLTPPAAHGGRMLRGFSQGGRGRFSDGQGPRFEDKNGDGFCDAQDRAEQ